MMARASAGLFEPVGPDDRPVPAGISVDYVTGLLLGQGILMALIARDKTGRGQQVTTDLFSGAFHSNSWNGTAELNVDRVEKEGSIAATEKALQPSFKTKDGYIELSPTFSETGLKDLSTAMGLADLSEDPRFQSNQAIMENSNALNGIVADRFLAQTTEKWIEDLEPQGILCADVKTLFQAAEDPQLQANNMVLEVDQPGAGPLRLQGTPIRLSETGNETRSLSASLGAHNEEVLEELGYTSEEIETFQSDGILG